MKKMKRIIKDMLMLAFWYPVRIMVQRLPFLIVYKLGDIFGDFFYIISPKRRMKTLNELSRIFQNLNRKAIKKIVRASYRNLIKNELDVFLYPYFSQEYKNNIERWTTIEGLENLQKAASLGKGILLIHTHFGNPQMLIPALGGRGYRINQIGRSPLDFARFVESQLSSEDKNINDPFIRPPSKVYLKIFELVKQYEEKLPANFIYIHQSSLPAFRALQRNEILAIAIDGRGGARRVIVTLFGRKVSFAAGPLFIALKTDAVVLPVFVLRLKDNSHKVIIHEPMLLERGYDFEQNLQINAQKIANLLSEYILKYPCHYARLFGDKRPYFID